MQGIRDGTFAWYFGDEVIEMDVTMCRMAEKPEKTYSTLQAAKKAKIHRATLIRWLQEGWVKASTEVPLAGGNILRRWSEADIKKLIQYREDFHRMPRELRDKK